MDIYFIDCSMGCHGSRKRYSQEEVALLSEELVLHFHAASTQQAYSVFRCKARGGFLNALAFAEAAKELGLCVQNSGGSLQVEAFFASLQTPQGYPEHSLGLLAVLLSEGSSQEKAETLFQLYDEAYTLELTKAQVVILTADLVHMSTVSLGLLVAGEQPGALRNGEYLKGLQQVSEAFQQDLVTEIMQGREVLTRPEFLKQFSENSRWRSASDLRVAMAEFRREHSRPQLVKP